MRQIRLLEKDASRLANKFVQRVKLPDVPAPGDHVLTVHPAGGALATFVVHDQPVRWFANEEVVEVEGNFEVC